MSEATVRGLEVRSWTLLALVALLHEELGELIRSAAIDFVVVKDDQSYVSSSRHDLKATSAAAAAVPFIGRTGVVVSTDISLSEPFNLAREIATLDIVSEGLAGLLVQEPHRVENFLEAGVAYTDTHDLELLAFESVEVIRRLWDSWEHDAVVRNWDTNQFLDASKIHPIHYEGRVLQVRGPSATPRSPQGLPPILIEGARRDSRPPATISTAEWHGLADALVVDSARLIGHSPNPVLVRYGADEMASADTLPENGLLFDASGAEPEAIVELLRSIEGGPRRVDIATNSHLRDVLGVRHG